MLEKQGQVPMEDTDHQVRAIRWHVYMPLSIRNMVSLMPISYFGFQLNTSLTLLKTWTRYVLLVLVFILAYVDLCSLTNRLYGLTFLTPRGTQGCMQWSHHR